MNMFLRIASAVTGFLSTFLYVWVAHTVCGWYLVPVDYKTLFGAMFLIDLAVGREFKTLIIDTVMLKKYLVDDYHITEELKRDKEFIEYFSHTFSNIFIGLHILFWAWVLKFFV
jgi:hypothetical protein